MKRARLRIDPSPLAATSVGALVLGITMLAEGDLGRLIQTAREIGGTFFFGLVVRAKHRDTLGRDIDDAGFDAGARLGADIVKTRRHHRRGTPR